MAGRAGFARPGRLAVDAVQLHSGGNVAVIDDVLADLAAAVQDPAGFAARKAELEGGFEFAVDATAAECTAKPPGQLLASWRPCRGGQRTRLGAGRTASPLGRGAPVRGTGQHQAGGARRTWPGHPRCARGGLGADRPDQARDLAGDMDQGLRHGRQRAHAAGRGFPGHRPGLCRAAVGRPPAGPVPAASGVTGLPAAGCQEWRARLRWPSRARRPPRAPQRARR